MRLLQTAARWEFAILLTAFAVVTMVKLFQTVQFSGLIRSQDGTLSPGRTQLLVITILTAMQYLLTVIHDPSHLPLLPSNLITALGGSQAVYLAAKAWDVFQSNRNTLRAKTQEVKALEKK